MGSDPRPFVDNYDLPSGHGHTYVTLVARDPHFMYAYWEISSGSICDVKRNIGEDEFNRSTYVLRMYDITLVDFNGGNANNTFDIEVGTSVNNWYINLWSDNATYCAEIGIRTSDGRFFSMARSNAMSTPRLHSSNRNEVMWMEVGGDGKTAVVPDGLGVLSDQQKKKKFEEDIKQRKLTGKKSVKVNGRKLLASVTEEDIKAYYAKIFPVLKNVISARRKGKVPRLKKKHTAVTGRRLTLDELLFKGMTKDQFVRRVLLGASEETAMPAGGASESFGGASERTEKQRKFFFMLNTELIVYGRTEPDATVHWGDKPVKLNPDGTFSMRMSLPDGEIPLDFVAESNDKVEKRRIATKVERFKTKYEP